jgi:hypothetical protein
LAPPVVTVTSTVPANSAGETAVIEVTPFTTLVEKLVAFVTPNLTAVAPARLVPLMTTDVPAATGPLVGLSFVTVGGA